MSVQRIVRIALLSAILYVCKVSLEWLPNVELVTLLVILYALTIGLDALYVTLIFNIIELIQWGFGTWWIAYLYIWPLFVIISLLLKKVIKEEFIIWAVLSGCFGLVFGALCSSVYLFIDPKYAWTYFIAGLPWDAWHAISNFIIMLLAGKPLYLLLKKTTSR
ncbi:MAG: hypothetical protein K6A38_04510 [Lachnospiraceae bacterium]|nr:hypothetical protein [Lachnospiraceae bacterium]